MKCKNCGADYRLRQLRCPYCETENLLGRMWLIKRTDTIKKVEAEQRAAKKKFVPYVVSKTVNRLILFMVVILIAFIMIFEMHMIPGSKKDADGKIITPKMLSLHEDGEYYKLREYLDSIDGGGLYTEIPEYMAQSALLAYDYNEFIEYRLNYLGEDRSKWEEDYFKMVIDKCVDIHNLEVGVYSGYHEENQKQYDEYNEYIMAFLKGTLSLTDEELNVLMDEDASYSEQKELIHKIFERSVKANE